MLSPFVPYPPIDGGRIRVYNILKGLAQRHNVDVLALAEPTEESRMGVAQLREEGFRVKAIYHRRPRWVAFLVALARRRSLYTALFYSPDFANSIQEHLGSKAYDVVQCEYSYLAQYRRFEGQPWWVLDEHNVEFRLNSMLTATQRGMRGLLYRTYACREQALRRAEEIKACRRADHVVAVSDVDRAYLMDVLPDLDVTVVPNGVDIHHFTPPGLSDKSGAGGVFIGKMNYRPNVDAVKWFCKEILPLVRRVVPSFTFTIVGANPTASVLSLSHLPGVHVTGRVADTRPYLAEAAVVVVPLRAGSGTRLKILEALAMGRAVVSTSIGCQGLETLDGEHLLQADDPALFADRVVKLLTEASERARLGQQGRCLVEKLYTWKQAVGTIETVYEALARKSKQEHAGVVR